MTKTSTTIVFFGSGPVAARSLELLAQDFAIEAVVTKPRAAHHRGEVPVLDVAERLNLPVFTATNKASLDQLISTKPFRSTAGVLIDFGIIVSQQVIDYFPLGIVNSHFSILPEWRGADPITFAILSGQKQTGVSLMLLVEAMDEGPLIGYGEYDIPAKTTTPELTDHLIKLSHTLLQRHLPSFLSGQSKGIPQSITERKVSYSRKLTKDDGVLDWSKPAEQLEREIRAFSEWPKSRCQLQTLDIIITRASVVDASGPSGAWTINGALPLVYCGLQALAIEELKPAGKQKMTGEAFLAGYKKLLS